MLNGVKLARPIPLEFNHVFSPEALSFVAELQRKFGAERERLLAVRRVKQELYDGGNWPYFLPYTRDTREDEWKVAPIPKELECRDVEITGPDDVRKMNISAMNSDSNCFMADSEDSKCPTRPNVLNGQLNMYDLVRRQIDFTDEKTGKEYKLNEKTAILFFRPRGWHLPEKNLLVDGQPVSASLFDFGIYFWNNARELLQRGTRPYFYLPKLQGYEEAQLWNDVFVYAQERLMIPRGTIRATVLIETLPAAFEMDEILYVLREHSAGLNCGRWDYIFSYIKTLRNHSQFVLPDRAQVTMDKGFLKAYCDLLVQTCHKRGAHAMGGMAAQIPLKDPEANAAALAKVTADKIREAGAGHDGAWVAHPGLVPVVKKVFRDSLGEKPNQLDVLREDVKVTQEDLLRPHQGTTTEQGLRVNINVGVQYLAAWLSGNGCVPLNNLMEDAATAEISRSQVWQWLHHKAVLAVAQAWRGFG